MAQWPWFKAIFFPWIPSVQFCAIWFKVNMFCHVSTWIGLVKIKLKSEFLILNLKCHCFNQFIYVIIFTKFTSTYLSVRYYINNVFRAFYKNFLHNESVCRHSQGCQRDFFVSPIIWQNFPPKLDKIPYYNKNSSIPRTKCRRGELL